MQGGSCWEHAQRSPPEHAQGSTGKRNTSVHSEEVPLESLEGSRRTWRIPGAGLRLLCESCRPPGEKTSPLPSSPLPSPLPPPSRLPQTHLPRPLSGQLSLNEFIEGARRDQWVMKMLQMDVNPGGWISQQRRRSAMF